MYELYMIKKVLILLVTYTASRCLAAQMSFLDVAFQSGISGKLLITEATLCNLTNMDLLYVDFQSAICGKLLITKAALYDLKLLLMGGHNVFQVYHLQQAFIFLDLDDFIVNQIASYAFFG